MKNIYLILLLSLCSIGMYAHGSNVSKYDSLTDISQFKKEQLLEKDVYKVIIFLNASCPCTKLHLPHLTELSKAHPKIKFIGIHTNNDIPLSHKKKLATQLKQKSHNVIVVDDPNLELVEKFKALTTPQILLLDKKNQIIFSGSATDHRSIKKSSNFYLRDRLQKITNGQTIETSLKKPLGCLIRRT